MGIVTTARHRIRSLQRRFRETFKKLVEVKMNESKLTEFLNGVFPDPKQPEGRDASDERYQKELARARQNRFWASYFFEQGNGNQARPVARTLWAAYNGVTELVDHRCRPNQSDGHRLNSIWFGDGYLVKARAFRIAENMVVSQGGLWRKMWNRGQPAMR